MKRPFDRRSVEEFPRVTGVYLFMDGQGRPVYVGKATDLRSRVRSYFGESDGRLVSTLLAEKARTMDFIVTDSAKEALILENSLIKKHAPLLNIRLKDDATYFSLRLDLAEEWPRLRIVRKRKKDEALYFGPYPSARACRKTIQYLNAIFPLRTCRDAVLANRSRPCLDYEIGRCKAPCVDLITRSDYMELAGQVIDFLKGRNRGVLDELKREMEAAAANLEFERAAELRDRLRHVERTLEEPQVGRRGGPDRDVLGTHETGDELAIAVLSVRDGSLAATSSFVLKRLGREMDEMLAGFLGQFYGPGREPPEEVLLPAECADLELHREILEEIRGAAVRLRVPERGEGVRLLRLAEKNAAYAGARDQGEGSREEEALVALKERVGLQEIPLHMECYDVSHLQGSQVVASRVVFKEGKPDKSHYRHYRLKEVQRNDDFAAMKEVLGRRLSRGLSEDDLPDLIVIDGGRAQLGKVIEAMEELGVHGVEVIGLAKARGDRARSTMARHERVYRPGEEVPLVLPDDAPETHLLARLRDEAHRFAINYGRRLRQKETIGTVLEMIPGVGPRKARALLETMGSVKAVRAATAAQLAEVPGITQALAKDILDWFAANGR